MGSISLHMASFPAFAPSASNLKAIVTAGCPCPCAGEFILTKADMKIPEGGGKKIYSCNEGNSSNWDEPIKKAVAAFKDPKKPYAARCAPLRVKYFTIVSDCTHHRGSDVVVHAHH